MIQQIQIDIQALANPTKAKILQGFFKTGKDEYGEGDIFLGLTVPQSRSIAKKYTWLTLSDIEKLLQSKIHEERQIALMILVIQFHKGTDEEKKNIYNFYLCHTKAINNWDLVDGSAPYIVGEYLFHCHSGEVLSADARINSSTSLREANSDFGQASAYFSSSARMTVLEKLAQSQSLWERRIAILATFAYIKRGKYQDTFRIADILLQDKHDLIHKAVGWGLREVEKKCGKNILEEYLLSRYKTMPRTMLRYAIEHFPQKERKAYLQGKV